MKRASFLILLLAAPPTFAADSDSYSLVLLERIEYQSGPGATVWDAQGFYGGDYNKVWWKTEGDVEDQRIESASADLLYSRAWTAFFDWQAGVRIDRVDGQQHGALAFGVQGLLPYRFEIDTALFVDADGTVRIRGEFERDLLVTQRWVLQPRAEIAAASGAIPDIAVSRGINRLDLEIRLRYEIRRKFAPYIGVSWQQAFGDARDAIEAAGADARELSFVIGLRAWF